VAAEPKIRISLLGVPRVERDGSPVTLPRRRTRALLFFLAAEPGPHTRNELTELCWPALTLSKGRRQLSDALSDLKRALGSEVVTADVDTVAWAGPPADVALQESRIAAGIRATGKDAATNLVSAADLFGGGFLAGFSLEDSESFQEWLEERRTRVTFDVSDALSRAARTFLDAGDIDGAIDAARRGIALDSLREDLWRLLMESHAARGDGESALQEYRRCREVLKRELGLAPAPETEAVRRRLSAEAGSTGAASAEQRAARARPPVPSSLRLAPGSVPLVGRERELGALLHRWQQAEQGHGGIALVSGEPGIGKSRLAAEFATRAAAAGAVVAAALCPDLDDPSSHGPIEEAIRFVLPSLAPGALSQLGPDRLAWLGRLIPEIALGTAEPNTLPVEEERARIAEAISSLFGVIGGGRPLLLIVEDLQWAHPATVTLLHRLARHSWPGMVLGTFRDTEKETPGTEALSRLVGDVQRDGLLERISLTQLSLSDAESLVKLALKAANSSLKTRPSALAQVAEGHPLFALELTRALLENPDDPDLPETLVTTIRTRLQRVSEPARRTLELAAVFGEPVSPGLLARASGVAADDEALIDAIDELTARRLLRDENRSAQLTIAHQMIAAVVYESLSSARKRALHTRAGSALESSMEQRSNQTELLIRHYRLAGEPLLAAERALQAAERARKLAEIDTAIKRFRAAADLLSGIGRQEEAVAAFEDAGDLATVVCGHDGAADFFGKALEIAESWAVDRDVIARLHRKMAELYARWGYDPEDGFVKARAHLETALELTPDAENNELSRIHSARGFIRATDRDLAGAEADAREALRLADPESLAWLQAMDCLAKVSLEAERWQEGLEATLQCVPVATKLGQLSELNNAYRMAAMISLALGNAPEAGLYAGRSQEVAGKAGMFAYVKMARLIEADSLCMLGCWQEAANLVQTYLENSYHAEELLFHNMMAQLILADALAKLGDPQKARDLVAKAEAMPRFELDYLGWRARVHKRVLETLGSISSHVELRSA
jgi:DNA-binding SARP family transcriptional activator